MPINKNEYIKYKIVTEMQFEKQQTTTIHNFEKPHNVEQNSSDSRKYILCVSFIVSSKTGKTDHFSWKSKYGLSMCADCNNEQERSF